MQQLTLSVRGQEERCVRQQLARPLRLVSGQNKKYDHLDNGAPFAVVGVTVA